MSPNEKVFEYPSLIKRGKKRPPNANIVTPIHKRIDSWNEEKSNQKIGTTCRGIGPAYVDKISRIGIRIGIRI